MYTYIHTYIHTYTHTHTYMTRQMAEVVSEDIQGALNKRVTTTDQSGNMKYLKKIIFKTVSNLRILFTELKGITEENRGKFYTMRPRSTK